MDKQPIRDERILESLDVCRPGSDDVADPELAHLAAAMAADPQLEEIYERLQKTDAVLAGSIQDVPVPDGLAQRLTGQLAAASQKQVAARPKRKTRRWLLIGGGSLTAAVVLLVAVVSFLTPPEPIALAEVLERGIEFFNEESPGTVYPLSENAPPSAYPFSSAVVEMPQTQWRRIRGFLGGRGVAYDLSGPGGTTATLYVVRRRVADAPESPPLRPGLHTAGFSVSTWQSQSQGVLYVLVVRGNPTTYRGFLNLPRGPVT